MNFTSANSVDILRSSQKDEQFTDVYANSLYEIFRLWGSKLTKPIHPISNLLYYYFTSLSNLQTLGEEYTGILRVSKQNIPNKLIHLTWLLLYIGGDDIFMASLNKFERKLKENDTLTLEAKTKLLKICKTIKNNKDLLIRFHQAVFYLNGKYYHISNRLTNIQYVFLRNWMQDDQSSKAFKVLGHISFSYLFFAVLFKVYRSFKEIDTGSQETEVADTQGFRQDQCILCTEVKKNPSTLPCGHVFCWDCTFNIVNYDLKCPNCREVFHPSRIIMLQNY